MPRKNSKLHKTPPPATGTDSINRGFGENDVPTPAHVCDVRWMRSGKGASGTRRVQVGMYVHFVPEPLPVTENFVLHKLPAWTEIPYTTIGPHTMQVQLDITGGVLDPAFILAPAEGISGDLNNDGKITPADACVALEIAAGNRPPNPTTLAAADVSGDGRVTSLDALMIMQAAAGAIDI